MVLRENGRVEVYSDFILVNHIYDPTFQCVDIEIGNSYFFLKHAVDSHLVTEQDDFDKLEFKFRKVKMKLKNRIGPSTLNPENTLDFMEQVIHRRAAPFYRMYTQMINFATFTIVAHRNLISMFNMGVNDRWEDTIQVS